MRDRTAIFVEQICDNFSTIVMHAVTTHVECLDIREINPLHQLSHEGYILDCLISQIDDRLVPGRTLTIFLELLNINVLVDSLVFLQLFLHFILYPATNTITLKVQCLNMFILLQRIHEFFHLIVANRIISQVNMLNEAELPHKLCQKIEILDAFLAQGEAH